MGAAGFNFPFLNNRDGLRLRFFARNGRGSFYVFKDVQVITSIPIPLEALKLLKHRALKILNGDNNKYKIIIYRFDSNLGSYQPFNNIVIGKNKNNTYYLVITDQGKEFMFEFKTNLVGIEEKELTDEEKSKIAFKTFCELLENEIPQAIILSSYTSENKISNDTNNVPIPDDISAPSPSNNQEPINDDELEI